MRRSCSIRPGRSRSSWRRREVHGAACSNNGRQNLRVGFYSNHLCERGSEVALYDYADYAERLLGVTAFVLYDAASPQNVAQVERKFRARFGSRVVPVASLQHIAGALESRSIAHCYIIKFGHRDEPAMRWFGATRTCVHCVFDATDPHGDVYARVSPCVPALPPPHGATRVVPHIVVLPTADEMIGPDLRDELGIPADATVFGRHGGWDTFDIPAARAAVLSVARKRSDIFFVLMNTKPLSLEAASGRRAPRNILYLELSTDAERKAAFIRSCDAMLHARLTGETFGLAIAEFSVYNKPVLTSRVHHECGSARFHLDTLGSCGLYYHDQASCERLLLSFDRRKAAREDWNAYRAFAPAAVMAAFEATFLAGPRGGPGELRGARAVVPTPPTPAAVMSSPFPCHEAFGRREGIRARLKNPLAGRSSSQYAQ